MPFAIVGLLLALLVPLSFALEEDEPSAPEPASLSVIAARVERLRGLRFREPPTPVTVTPGRAREEGLADLDRGYPAARRRADEALYTLLGLFPPGTDLRRAAGSIFGEGVGGYYDPRDGRLRIVSGAATAGRVMTEIVLAHELNHALEDQHFSLSSGRLESGGDGALAYQALVEGTATALMFEYLGRHFSEDEALGGLLGSAFAPQPDLPPFLSKQLTFPYLAGQEFVTELYDSAGGTWRLIDAALQARPPASTEQVLHPEAYLRFEGPRRVSLGQAARELRTCCTRLTAGTLGEWQTGELLALAGRAVPQAADGWGGDRFELWRRREVRSCRAPCVGQDVLVARWAWESERDATEFLRALRAWADDGLEARPAGGGRWSSRGGAIVVSPAGARGVVLAMAPDPDDATAVARLAAR